MIDRAPPVGSILRLRLLTTAFDFSPLLSMAFLRSYLHTSLLTFSSLSPFSRVIHVFLTSGEVK